jgi:Cytochrome C'
MRRSKIVCRWVGIAAIAIPTLATAKEARPPVWSRDVVDTFFDDARDRLEGERPDYGSRSDAAVQGVSQPLVTGEAKADSNAFAWSALISPETLESETKRLAQSLGTSVTTPSGFKGGGFKEARRDFGELAVLFAVSAQYDGRARWKDTAASLRELFARAARNAKVGSDATFREATLRKQDLAELIRGGRPQVPQADAAVDDWSQVAARPSLMQRLNVAHQERLVKWVANEKDFGRNRDDIAHEAQIVAVIANVIHRPDYEYSDDDTFVGYAEELQRAASDVSAAAGAENVEQARDAISRATNACANCHEGYRG